MTRTNIAPWDHKQNHPMPSDDLFAICRTCGYRLGVKNGGKVDCHKCETLGQKMLTAEELSAVATCSICLISKDLRVCNECSFNVGTLVALAYGTADLTRVSLNDMTDEQQKKWFDNIEPLEF